MADVSGQIAGEQKAKGTKMRSPSHPAINLETAIQRAKAFYLKERRSAANVAVAIKNWGFEPKSSGGILTLAALKAFGLLTDEGSGTERTVKLSDLALRIILDERTDSTERDQAIKDAALRPKMHANLWNKCKTDLPSDDNLRHALIFTWKFNENSVDDFIREYKSTIAFAKLTNSDTISGGSGDLNGDDGDSPIEDPPPVSERPPSQSPKRHSTEERPNMRQDVFSLAEGEVTIQWPASLSPESYEDLGDWLDILKRKIGRSVKTSSVDPTEGGE